MSINSINLLDWTGRAIFCRWTRLSANRLGSGEFDKVGFEGGAGDAARLSVSPARSVMTVLVVPVSGLGKVRHREFLMAAGEMTLEAFTQFLTAALERMKASCHPGSPAFICMDWRHLPELLAAARAWASPLPFGDWAGRQYPNSSTARDAP